MLNQQNTSLSHGSAEVDASKTGLLDFIQNEKEAQTEKESDTEELQAEKEKEGSEEDKDILTESRLNEETETNKEEMNQRIERENGLSVPEAPSLLLSPCEFSQHHAVPQERYSNMTNKTLSLTEPMTLFGRSNIFTRIFNLENLQSFLFLMRVCCVFV